MKRTSFALILGLFIGLNTLTAQTIYYVKENATGKGTSWTDALGNLQDAIDSAELKAVEISETVQVWVADGTYFPTFVDDDNDPRTASFVMKNNVAIYGGFNSDGDPGFTDRDPENNQTILSGDLGISDDISDNAYHVICNDYNRTIRLDTTAILDGFTIEKGYIGEASGYGTAIDCYYASPIIINCIIKGEDNTLISATRSDIKIRNCTISDFTGDQLIKFGSGFEDTYTEMELSGCTIENNETVDYMIYVSYYLNLHVDNCYFNANQNTCFEMNHYSNLLLENSIFENNFGDKDHGAILEFWTCDNSDYYIIRNCSFINNTCSESGGILYGTSSDKIDISNCLFAGNTAADGYGGALYVYSTPLTVTNCTFYNNTSTDGGDAIANNNYYGADCIISNSIFWGESDDQVYTANGAVSTTNNSLVKMASTEVFSGDNNLNTDPIFTNAGDLDFSLKSYSPCVNTGDNSLYSDDNLLTTDLAGSPRFYDNGIIDMGCYELQEEKTTQSVSEGGNFYNLDIYPNPVSKQLFIDVPENENISSISIMDISGKLIYSTRSSEKKIDISNLKNGVYIIEVATDRNKGSEVFLKE